MESLINKWFSNSGDWGQDEYYFDEDEYGRNLRPNIPNSSVAALCPAANEFPHPEEYQLGLGESTAIALYACGGTLASILVIEFAIMLKLIMVAVPREHRSQTIWIHSIYVAIGVLTCFSIAMPRSSQFIWSTYKVYVGVAMNKFVDLILSWNHGDENIISMNDGKTVNLRKPPCCLCFCCPIKATMNKKTFRLIRWSVHQMPYVQAVLLFLVMSLELSGHLTYDNFSFSSPDLYLQVAILSSFLTAMWGLFLIFHITDRYNLMRERRFQLKATILKAMVVFVNIQTLVIDLCTAFGAIGCNYYLSSVAFAAVYKDICTILESFILGNLIFFLTVLDTRFRTTAEENSKKVEENNVAMEEEGEEGDIRIKVETSSV